MVVFGGLGMKLCASVLRSWRIPRFFSSKFAITVYTKLAAVILLGDVRVYAAPLRNSNLIKQMLQYDSST